MDRAVVVNDQAPLQHVCTALEVIQGKFLEVLILFLVLAYARA